MDFHSRDSRCLTGRQLYHYALIVHACAPIPVLSPINLPEKEVRRALGSQGSQIGSSIEQHLRIKRPNFTGIQSSIFIHQ
jgi:hypothetical protein